MKKHTLAFIDLETTGLNPYKHEIIEIGCLLARQVPESGRGARLEFIEDFSIRVKPVHLENAEPEALRITGYNEADWLFASDLKPALQTLVDKATDTIMVAQNITFDWSFLSKALFDNNIQPKFHYHRIDLMSMAFMRLYHQEGVQRFSLWALAEYFGIKQERAHTALDDVRVSFQIYSKLIQTPSERAS